MKYIYVAHLWKEITVNIINNFIRKEKNPLLLLLLPL